MKIIYSLSITLMTFLANAQSINPKFNSSNRRANIVDYSQNQKTSSPTQLAAGIFCSQQYTPGVSQTFILTLNIVDTGGEYGDSLSITFPSGFTINSALPNDSIGINEAPTPVQSNCPNTESGTKEPYRGIFGQSVVWGNNDNCYGGLPEANYTTTISVSATIGSGVTGPKTVNFHLSGDGNGSSPSDFNGSFTIYPSGPSINHDFQATNVFIWNTTGNYADANNCGLGVRTVYAVIKNVGNVTEPYVTAGYSVNGVLYGPFYVPTSFGTGVQHTISFPIQYNFGANNVYKLKAWANIPGESNHSQDTASITLSNTNPTPLGASGYSNGIETLYNYGSLNLDWIGSPLKFERNTNSHSGAYALDLSANTGLGIPTGSYTAYINLPCLLVQSGQTYRISFWKRMNGSTSSNGETGVRTGIDQAASFMSTTIKPQTPITIYNTWIKDSIDYTATANEIRYFSIVGSGNFSSTSDINVQIDDIKINKVLNTVGITSNHLDSFSISPNPTTGLITIDNNKSNAYFEIYNINGQIITLNNPSELSIGKNEIDLSELSCGTYFVKIIEPNGIKNKKIIIIK